MVLGHRPGLGGGGKNHLGSYLSRFASFPRVDLLILSRVEGPTTVYREVHQLDRMEGMN